MIENLVPALIFFALGLGIPEDHDKAKHFSMGASSAFLADGISDRPWAGCGAAFSLGVVKEVFDSRTGGDVDTFDALATGLGCSVTFRF